MIDDAARARGEGGADDGNGKGSNNSESMNSFYRSLGRVRGYHNRSQGIRDDNLHRRTPPLRSRTTGGRDPDNRGRWRHGDERRHLPLRDKAQARSPTRTGTASRP